MTEPQNDRLAGIRGELEVELAAKDSELVVLRGQRTDINDQIKAKVAERAELQGAINKLTPRTRKVEVAPEVTA